MIEPPNPNSNDNSIPHAILSKERNNPLTNVISHSDIKICESPNFRQMNEIKNLKANCLAINIVINTMI